MTPADRYQTWLPHPNPTVQESPPSQPFSAPTELEIQARWFAGEFGREFTTLSGDSLEIIQFGEWNRESGPDFSSAAVSLNGQPPQRGSIELDPDVRDWERHGHAINPAYENVLLHVFWNEGPKKLFTQTLGARNVPQIRLDLTKTDPPLEKPAFTAIPGRCVAPLAKIRIGKIAELFAAAAHYRMQKKAQRISQTAEIHGEHEALYQSLAQTLGYKSNKLPFLLLAQRLPLRRLRKKPAQTEALLFGFSGFLAETDLHPLPQDTKNYLRRLWTNWWPHLIPSENRIFPPGTWTCGGVRPANHPQRRLGALTQIAQHWPKVRQTLHSANPQAISRFFSTLHHPYWDHHYTLTSAPAPRPMALLGPDRVNAIIANVVLPLALHHNPLQFEKLQTLAAPDLNLRVKTAAIRLFGTDAKHLPLLKNALHQQGLLQIYEDFCSKDSSNCSNCPFPHQLHLWF